MKYGPYIGRYSVVGLRLGSYRGVALTSLAVGDVTNPTFLNRLRSVAPRVQLTESEKYPFGPSANHTVQPSCKGTRDRSEQSQA
jgi:hypothetical protein